MPYDPRPVSEGGNAGIGETFSREAPPGKFRLVCVDTFDGGDWVQGDFDTIEAAMAEAKKHNTEMMRIYVYDDTGRCLDGMGTF